MIKLTKKEWNKIPSDYKGKWDRSIKEDGWQPDLPEEYIGKRTMMDNNSRLLTEGIHFVIVD